MVAAVETLAYVADRGTPWHKQGTPVPGLMTAREALVASGLDWAVEKRSLAAVGFPEKFGLYRSTDDKGLGIVGTRYRVIQNEDAFSFADNLVDSGEAKYETAGSLFEGRKVFLSMELNHLDLQFPGDDSDTKTFLLIANSHDGTGAADAAITMVRSVCANTVTAALSRAQRRFRIRHSGDISKKMLAARDALGITFKYVEKYQAAMTALALKQVTDQQVRDIVNALWPVADDLPGDADLSEHPATLALENYLTSPTMDSIRGTAWGAFNGIAEFLDYGVVYRGRTHGAADTRTLSLLKGSADAKKTEALKALQTV